MKQQVTITLDQETLSEFRAKAISEHRSLSQQVSMLIEKELGVNAIKPLKPTRRRKHASV